MKEPVLSTYRIIKEKAFNADIGEGWIDWAIEMMLAGYEAESLYQLAGIRRPFNQFELQDLTDRVLSDLHLDYSNKEKAVKDYVYFIIRTNTENTAKYYEILKEFRDIYYQLDRCTEYEDFALLYWAKDDLVNTEDQWYWEGADRSNMDIIIKEQFQLWITKFELEKLERS